MRNYHICGECRFWDESDKRTVGCRCQRPNHFWKSQTTAYKQKCNKACKAFEKR